MNFTISGREMSNQLKIVTFLMLIVVFFHCNNNYSQTRKTTLAEKIVLSNPVDGAADLIAECSDDGTKMPKIFLCGASAKRQIIANFTNISFIYWDKLNEGSCAAVANSNCANKSNTCTWTQVETGSIFEVSSAGQYKIRVVYSDNSQSAFYFNVYTNPLEIPVTGNDVFCGNPGEIRVTKLTGYEYSLDGITYQSSNIFAVSTAGDYIVRVRREGATTKDCVFEIPKTIAKKDLTVTPLVTQPVSSAQLGSIKLTVNDVRAQYYYKIVQGATIIDQKGPVLESEYTFPNLNSGAYTWSVKTEDCDWITGNVTFTTISPFQITKNVKPVSCQPGSVEVFVSGGTAPYKYYFNGKTTPEASNLISVAVAGTYTIKVVDSNNQSDTITVEVPAQAAPVYTIEKTNENCYYPNSWQIKFNVSNANGNSLRYSIDNGATFSTNPVFQSLSATPAGTVFKTIIEYTFDGVKCTKAEDVVITQPQYGLSATAGVSELIGCQSSPDEDKAKIRITNPQGGTPPYRYSYDDKKNWTTSTSSLHPAGEYVFYIRDTNGCVSAMSKVIVENIGVPVITVTNDSFNCDGTANTTVNSSTATATKFSYSYSLDTNPFQSANNFTNIAAGNHTMSVKYEPLIVPTYSNLLKEDFGYGGDTTSPGMSSAYCFEKQVFPATCNTQFGWGPNINDGEYAVTTKIVYPFVGAWYVAVDHTNPSIAKGRFLVVNVKGDNTRPIIYEKTINDIIPNQPINVEFYATNLLRIGNTQFNSNLRIALVNAAGTEIDFYNTGSIPKTEKWEKYSTQLNPGNNTTLKFQVRSIEQNQSGNDFAIDDISAYQIPKICTTTKVVNFTVPSDKGFDATITDTKKSSCAGLSDGEISIAVKNFNSTTGYQYSKDNGATWQTATTSPFKITNLGEGSYTIKARYSSSATGVCVKTFLPITIIVPKPLVTTATVSTLASCSRGATITASSTEGTPFYKFELWDELNTTNIRPIQNSGVFENVPPGKYVIRGLDANGCASSPPFSITVLAPLLPVATLKSNSDLCYDATNQAQLEIDVTSGTAPFSYSLDGDPAQTSNIFKNVGPGIHTVEVIDSNSCKGITQNINIGNELKSTAALVKPLDCTTNPDAVIKLTIEGGTRPLRYQIKKGNTVITSPDIALADSDSSINYIVSEINAATYSFIIIDANGCTKTTLPITVSPKVNPKIDSLTESQSILCNGQTTAAIKVNLDTAKGVAPFTYSVKEITSLPGLVYGNQLAGLPAGKYEVTVTDSKSCTNTEIIRINEPAKIILNWDKNDITCNETTGLSKGSVIVKSVTGGKAPYNYFVTGVNGYNNFELNNSGTLSHTFDVVDFGLYQINIVDANGCSVLQQNVLVASPPEDLDINVTAIPTICASGGSSIVAVADIAGFSSSGPFYFAVYKPGLVYDSTNPAWQIGDASKKTTFTGLIPGVKYTFIVYDSITKCYHFKTAESSISTNSTLEISDPSFKNITCKGSADGKVSFTIKNNYSVATSVSYQIFNSLSLIPVTGVTGTTSIPANGSVTITDVGPLSFGNYFVLLKEGIGAPNEGCSIASKTFNITESAKDLDLSSIVQKNVNCNEYGVISLQAKDGTASYQYQISTVNSPTSILVSPGTVSTPLSTSGVWGSLNTFTVNQGGSYTVSVQDAYGCVKSQSVTIIKDPEPKIDLSISNLCVKEGAFEINVAKTTDGIAPYYISVNGSVFTPVTFPQTISNQNSGDYDITVKDVNGCTHVQNKTIYRPLGLSSEVIQLESCNGIDAKIDAVSVGGSGNFEYKIDSGTYTNSPNFSGLSSGNHNLYIRDKTTSCEKNIPVNLEPPTPVTGLSLSQKLATCHAGNDGSITATIATPAKGINDNPVYKYSLNGGSPQESNIFSGLVSGTYTVEAISGRGCKSPSSSIRVEERTIINVPNPSVVEFGCSSGNIWSVASITVRGVTGGSNTYTQYEFIKNGTRVQFGANTSYVEADLSGGSYTINVYDDKGCTGSTTAIIQPFYTLEKINVVPTIPISCIANETIQVTASAIGGTPTTLEFSLSALSGSLLGSTIPSNSTGIFPGLTVGEYLITVRNTATNCSIKEVYAVNEPNNFDLTINSVAPVTCFGGSNGNASITLIDRNSTSKAGAFSYVVKDNFGSTIITSTSGTAGPVLISNLKAAIYSITVTLSNAPFCSVTKKFTIIQPVSVLSLTESHSDITCALGNNDGKITALTTGGWTDFYEYKWEKDGTLIQDWGDLANLTDLKQGNYQVSVRDAKGCQVQRLVNLKNPTPISFTAASDTSVLRCYADRTATISATGVSGGQGSNYWYALNQISPNVVSFGPQASNEFKNLGLGKYTLKINDNWSCESSSVVIEIKEPANVVATLALKTPPTCVNSSVLDLQITGGTPPYSYSTNNVNFNLVVPNPINGNIGVNRYFIKDSNGCGSYLSNDIVVGLPNGLSVSTDKTFAKINCKGDSTASILATAQGGLGNYTYILLDSSNLPIGLPNATGIFTSLKAGAYKVKVTSADCQPGYSSVINIVEPSSKLNSKYDPKDALCAKSNDGTIKVITTGGTVAINYAISPNLSQFTESDFFNNLAPGNYNVLVQDALGCYEKSTLKINEPIELAALTIATSIGQEICFDDKNAKFSILLSGGILPYQVALDNPNGTYTTGTASQYQFNFEELKGGSHTVYIKDANNCTFDWTVKLDDSVKLDPTVTVDYTCVSNAQHSLVTVSLDSSITDLTLVQFALDGGIYQSSNLFTNLSPGDHFIRVKHNNGCIKDTSVFNILKVEPLTLSLKEGGLNEIIAVANGGAGNYKFTFDGEYTGSNPNYIYYKTQDYLVTVQEANGCKVSVTQKYIYIDICVPNYFTPNGDGTSDTWAPGCTVNYKNLTFTVLDRYGRNIQSFNYGESWDGKYNGMQMPSGDYWYVLKLNNSKDNREFVGHFTLYR